MRPSWNWSRATGNAAIDDPHRRLLGLVDTLDAADLVSADPRVVADLLDRVMRSAISHFMMEESLMERVDYPQCDQDEMIAQHRSVLPLLSFRGEWLTDEFGLDQRLADFIRRKVRQGRKPRTALQE